MNHLALKANPVIGAQQGLCDVPCLCLLLVIAIASPFLWVAKTTNAARASN